jgi:hypothetical protein
MATFGERNSRNTIWHWVTNVAKFFLIHISVPTNVDQGIKSLVCRQYSNSGWVSSESFFLWRIFSTWRQKKKGLANRTKGFLIIKKTICHMLRKKKVKIREI